jgi:hypothetical protein
MFCLDDPEIEPLVLDLVAAEILSLEHWTQKEKGQGRQEQPG